MKSKNQKKHRSEVQSPQATSQKNTSSPQAVASTFLLVSLVAISLIFIAATIHKVVYIDKLNANFPRTTCEAAPTTLIIAEPSVSYSFFGIEPYYRATEGEGYLCHNQAGATVGLFSSETADHRRKTVNALPLTPDNSCLIEAYWYGYGDSDDLEAGTFSLSVPSTIRARETGPYDRIETWEEASIQLIAQYDDEQTVIAELPIDTRIFTDDSGKHQLSWLPGCVTEIFRTEDFADALAEGKIPEDYVYRIPADADYIHKVTAKLIIEP